MKIKKINISTFNSEVMEENELKANMFSSIALLIAACMLGVSWLLNMLDMFMVDKRIMTILFLSLLPTTVSPYILTKIVKCKKKWLKYYIMFCAAILSSCLDVILTYNITLFMIFPVVLSCHYYSRRLSINTATVTAVVFTLSTYLGVRCGLAGFGMVDLNFTTMIGNPVIHVAGDSLTQAVIQSGKIDMAGSITDAYQYGFVPRLFAFSVLTIVCVMLSDRTRALLKKQVEATQEAERISTELSVATNIQDSMLPKILPTFPGREEFDMFASMSPAKEVGGDFYDCFFVDEDHFAFVIADVSGKGVPAALFMVISKTLIKNHVQSGLSPAEALTETNRQLCEGNEETMFVTAWTGVYEISTRTLRYVNAGHSAPVLKRASGAFEYVKEPPQLLLAVMDFAEYTQKDMVLHPGDTVYLFTDGVTEATNARNELYGEDRLLAVLNAHSDADVRTLCDSVKADVDAFVGDAPQFDDITMLALHAN